MTLVTMNDDDVIDAGPVLVIEAVRLTGAPYTLAIRYGDGTELETDLSGLIHKRESMAGLRNEEAFAKVRIAFHGAGLEWDAGPDLSADALRHLAEVQQDMTGQDFADWMQRMGLSNNEAADALGAGLRTVKAYKTRSGALPPMVTIACRAMERDGILRHARLRPRRTGRPVSLIS